jgi:hypothetical protein
MSDTQSQAPEKIDDTIDTAQTSEQIAALTAEKEAAQISKEAQDRVARETAPSKPAEPKVYYVLDTSAAPENPSRTHEQIIDGGVQTFSFTYGKPTALPLAVATKFLRHDSFKLCDAQGRVVNYRRVPRQPDDLGAGEKFKLGDNETIARYDELTTSAILQRALELPGGERFAAGITAEQRPAVIDFIKDTFAKLRKANQSKEADIGADDFVPEYDESDAA